MGLLGVCGRWPHRWVLRGPAYSGCQGSAHRQGSQCLGPARGLGPQALGAPGVMAPAFSPVGPAQSPCPTRGVYTQTHTRAPCRQRHMLSSTCMLTRLPVHAQPCAHTCSPAGPCITGLAKQQSERWGTWVPGKVGEPRASRSGAQPQLPCVAGGREWKKGLLGPPRGSLSPGCPGRLCTIGARVPSSLLAAPILPASLKGSGPHMVGER